MPTPERTWRDVAVYHTYPMSREKCASCEKITGYFCSICENPVCLNCQQKHSDDHWSHPKPKQVVHLSEVANYPEGELQHLPEPRAGDVVASWSSLGQRDERFYERYPRRPRPRDGVR